MSENNRVLEAVTALRTGNARVLGRLLFKSHRSLSRNFAVSSQALDTLVQKAKASCYITGARLHGGGFGGYTINLVSAKNIVRARIDIGQDGIIVEPGRGAESWRI